MNARFDELLPFYVNGTLAEADRAWVESYLREHPKAAAELHWCRSLKDKIREDQPAVSSEVGMERALRRIRTEGPAPQAVRRAALPTAMEKLRDWFASLVPQPMLRPAFIGAMAVVALQTVVIVQMAGTSDDDDASQMRAIPGKSVVEPGPWLKVNFKGEAREADIRMLLVETHGSLAAGPGQLGDYYVHVPSAQVAAVSDKFKASGIVDAVAVVDALPARP
jgi:hypothetical protein